MFLNSLVILREMKSINQEIAHYLNSDIVLQRCLQREIVNIRALAQYLLKQYALPYTMDAVISAIRRYDVSENTSMNSEEIQKAFSKVSLSTKDNVALILLKDRAFKEIAEDFLGKKILKDNFRLIKSKETVTLVVHQKELDAKISVFKSQDIIRTKKNLAEIRIQFHKDVTATKGIIARIASELALRNINIEEIIYSVPDVLVYVQEGSLIEAHKSLQDIKTN